MVPFTRLAPVLLSALVLVAAAAVSARAPAATACVSTPVLQCQFSCPTSGWVSIVVTAGPTSAGVLAASGAAVCGEGSASCSELDVPSCEDQGYTDGGDGFCDLTLGTSATCSFTPGNFAG